MGKYVNMPVGPIYSGGPCRGLVHVIEKGDTLYKLGKKYHVCVSQIMFANPYVNIYNLQIGDELCIPVANVTEPVMPLPQPMPMPTPTPLPAPMPLPTPTPLPAPMPMPIPTPLPAPAPMPLPQPMPAPMPIPMPLSAPVRAISPATPTAAIAPAPMPMNPCVTEDPPMHYYDRDRDRYERREHRRERREHREHHRWESDMEAMSAKIPLPGFVVVKKDSEKYDI